MKKVKIERNENFEYTVTFSKLTCNQFIMLRYVLNWMHFPLMHKKDRKELEKISNAIEGATKEFFNNGPGKV